MTGKIATLTAGLLSWEAISCARAGDFPPTNPQKSKRKNMNIFKELILSGIWKRKEYQGLFWQKLILPDKIQLSFFRASKFNARMSVTNFLNWFDIFSKTKVFPLSLQFITSVWNSKKKWFFRRGFYRRLHFSSQLCGPMDSRFFFLLLSVSSFLYQKNHSSNEKGCFLCNKRGLGYWVLGPGSWLSGTM